MSKRLLSRLLLFVAATLGVASALHLSGVDGGGSEPFDPSHAGIAEAVIGAVLAAGGLALARGWRGARRLAIAATAFAVAGFLVGLQFTVRGGGAADIAYHAAVLPLLLLMLATLSGASRRARASRRTP